MKHTTNPLLRFPSAAIAASAFTLTAHAADLTWNAALPGTWNTSNTSWSGSTWNNGTPDNATFNNTDGTVTLTEAITGGSLNYYGGGVQSGGHQLLLAGSNLSVGSVLSWGGYGPLGGSVDSIGQAYGHRLAISNNLTVTGNATARRGMLYVLSGSLNVSGTINSADAWSVFRADSSTVSATGGIDFSTIACQVEIYGSTVTTPFIKVGNAAFAGQGGLGLGGATLIPTGPSSDFIPVYNNGDTSGNPGSRGAAGISNGGLTIDTAYAVTVATQLVGDGGAFSGLTKSGSGTLTLNQRYNYYTGGTTVNQGTLVLAADAWTLSTDGGGAGGAVTVGNGATLTADNSVANKLGGLTLNGGTVNAINSSGNSDWGNFFLTGNVSASGTSNLNADVALRMSTVDFNVASGGTLNVGGTMHNGAGFGSAGISKSGTGTMVLTGTHTYTGATSVSAGKLIINGNNSAATGAVTVASGATLGGSGTVGGATTIQSGGHLAVGNSPGTETFNSSLTFDSGSIFDWELNASTTDTGTSNQGTYDKVIANGAVSGTSVFTVALGTNSFTDAFWDTNKSWSDIFTGSGSFDLASIFTTFGGAGVASNGLVAGQGQFSFTSNTLSWSAVPEPTSALSGLLIAAGLLRRKRNA